MNEKCKKKIILKDILSFGWREGDKNILDVNVCGMWKDQKSLHETWVIAS